MRQNKNHLKFPLYVDEEIGFTAEACERLRIDHNLHEASADEDYETDKEILRKTINVCKKDVYQALKHVQSNPLTF